MKTFHKWLAEREQRQREVVWLNDKNAVLGLSKLNPLPADSAVNKSLSEKAQATTVRRAGAESRARPARVSTPLSPSNRHSL